MVTSDHLSTRSLPTDTGADECRGRLEDQLGTITAIYQSLQHRQSVIQLSLINTRVMLETGINLRSVSAEQDRDPALVAKVKITLHEMGVTT